MKSIKPFVALILILFLQTSVYCQKSDQFVLCHIDARFYKFNRNITVGLKENELKNYSSSYNSRFKEAFKIILKEQGFQFIKNVSDVDISDLNKLDSISDYSFDAYRNYMQTHKYNEKRINKNKPTPQHILNLLTYFGNKYNIDHLGIIKAEGFVKEKPDKSGQFDENARGYIYFKGYDIDVKTGRILFEFWESHPRQSSVSGPGHGTQQKLDVLTYNIIEMMSRKYLREFAKLWSKNETPKWKKAGSIN